MARSSPTLPQMLSIIDETLGDLVADLEGNAQFEVRVLQRLLQILSREVESGPSLETAQRTELSRFLEAGRRRPGTPVHERVPNRDLTEIGPEVDSGPATLDELNRSLCHQIRSGQVGYDDPQLLAMLRGHVQGQLSIDNPKFRSEHHDARAELSLSPRATTKDP